MSDFVPTFTSLWAIYSADPELSLSDLKKGKFSSDIDLSEVQKFAAQHEIFSISQQDESYSQRLKMSPSAPFLLYYQGNLSLLNHKILGLVGPRNPSEYAHQVMQTLFVQVSKYQLVTVSGLARGVDQQAHVLSLKYQVPTIAVLWWGFQYYLRGKEHDLLQTIVDNWWLVISQFKFDFEPTKRSFPARNKLLAQLCDVLFLPEAQEKSGSLITTEFAFQYQKPVYSVPASIFAQQSSGIFAKMVEKKLTLISDFWAFLDQHFVARSQMNCVDFCSCTSPKNLSAKQLSLYQFLQKNNPASLENLLEQLKYDYTELMQELTFLEMEGLIQQSRPWFYGIV